MRAHVLWLIPMAVTAALVGVALVATPADAKKRRKACMADHFHYGSSTGKATKKKARIAAIASWADFTAFEYGGAWARFKRARSRRVSCNEDATGWNCSVEAVPCR